MGLALLYSSGFAFHLIHRMASYFIASVWNDLIFPTLIAVVVVALFLRLTGTFLGKYRNCRCAREVALIGLAALLVIGLRGLVAASGYSIETIVRLFTDTEVTSWAALRVYKLAILLAAASLIYVPLRFLEWPRGPLLVVRFSAALGFSLFALAAYNVLTFTILDHGPAPLQKPAAQSGVSGAQQNKAPYRVVWIIFDELDYRQALGDQSQDFHHDLHNFQWLAENGVTAYQAVSPSNSTLHSIPSLLTGIPIKGAKILGPANYQLLTSTANSVQFSEENSIFGYLHREGKSFAIMGFHHPYCTIFTNANRCFTRAFGLGDWHEALIAWVPGPARGDPMASITSEQISRLPSFLHRTEDALTFVHMNIPHLPAFYAFKHFGQPDSLNYQGQYSANLKLADEILGQIIKELKGISSNQDVLLIVSSDHGLRRVMKNPDEPRPVPWIAWRIGAHDGQSIITPLSTVHTAALIKDFVDGKLNSQSDIAKWWRGKPVFAPWTELKNYDY